MGHSGAYGGSGGRNWQIVRDSVADLADTPADADRQAQLLTQIADALDWDRDAPAGDPGQGGEVPAPVVPDGEQQRPAPIQIQRPFGRLVRPRGGSDRPGGGGAGGVAGGGGGGAGGGGATGGGGRRSRRRASSVGGAVLAAGLAVRSGDGATLGALGLSLDQLRTLGPVAQCSRILNALVGTGADIDEAEMRSAASTALVAVLTEDLSPVAAVRTFIVEYVMEITVTEIGATMRETGTGEVSVEIEDGLRSLISAQVDQLALDGAQLGPQHLQDALYSALGSARAVLRAMS
jgi:hypothetical protein